MEALLTPAFGTVVWSTIAFLVVLFLLRKMAWGPILQALKEREESIANALVLQKRRRPKCQRGVELTEPQKETCTAPYHKHMPEH